MIAQAILSFTVRRGHRGTRECTANEPAMRTRPWLVDSCSLRMGTMGGLCWFWLPEDGREVRRSGSCAVRTCGWQKTMVVMKAVGDLLAPLGFFSFFSAVAPSFPFLGPANDDKMWGCLEVTWGSASHQPPAAWQRLRPSILTLTPWFQSRLQNGRLLHMSTKYLEIPVSCTDYSYEVVSLAHISRRHAWPTARRKMY